MQDDIQKIGRLIRFPLKKSLEIAVKSLRVRFFRSMITTLSLVLAIAFFSYFLITIDAANGLLASGDHTLRQRLVKSGFDALGDVQSVGKDPKQMWLLALSLLVCIGGIVNAQLMSVTERFREIGTMKCLGALDRFIFRLFIIEAGIQGLVGGLAGALIGALAAIASAAMAYGLITLVYLPWAALMVSIAQAVGVGMGLSLLGVVYPAWLAARMQPVEAMRVEQ